jgi:hypothetical protein
MAERALQVAIDIVIDVTEYLIPCAGGGLAATVGRCDAQTITLT